MPPRVRPNPRGPRKGNPQIPNTRRHAETRRMIMINAGLPTDDDLDRWNPSRWWPFRPADDLWACGSLPATRDQSASWYRRLRPPEMLRLVYATKRPRSPLASVTKIEAISYLNDQGWCRVSDSCWLAPGWRALGGGSLSRSVVMITSSTVCAMPSIRH